MYTKIESQFWKDEKIMKLSGDGRYLMLYLLTSPHRNIIGCYFLPEPYACFDLGWSSERFREALHELIKAGRVMYDEQNHILLIPNYLKFNPLENPNQVKSAIEKLNELPQTQLFHELLKVVASIDKQFIKPLLQRLQERLPQPVYSNQYTVSSNSNDDDDDNACAREEEDEVKTAEVYAVIEREFGPVRSGLEADFINDLISNFPRDWIIEAIRIAVLNKARNTNYVARILSSWRDKGYSDQDKPWERERYDNRYDNRNHRRPAGNNRAGKTSPAGARPSVVDWANEPDTL